MAYDNNLKLLVIKYRDAGHTFSEVYEAFGVDAKRYHAWKKEFEETGTFRLFRLSCEKAENEIKSRYGYQRTVQAAA
jgi:transposase